MLLAEDEPLSTRPAQLHGTEEAPHKSSWVQHTAQLSCPFHPADLQHTSIHPQFSCSSGVQMLGKGLNFCFNTLPLGQSICKAVWNPPFLKTRTNNNRLYWEKLEETLKKSTVPCLSKGWGSEQRFPLHKILTSKLTIDEKVLNNV